MSKRAQNENFNVLAKAYQQLCDEDQKEEFRNVICVAFEIKPFSFYNYLQGTTPLKKLQAEKVVQIVETAYPQIKLEQRQ